MKKFLMGCTVALSMGACATGPSSYGPAIQESSLGFHSQRIEQDRFRVSYTGRSSEEAQDYALLRAAEITLGQGYSHFRIVGGQLEDQSSSRSPVASSIGVGLGSGGGYYGRSRTNVGIGISINDVARALQGSRIKNIIEIRLLEDESDHPDVYDAASVMDSIRPSFYE